MMALGAVHWGTLLHVIWVSLVAGVAVSAIFSFVVLASTRASECSRAGRSGAALGFGVLAVLTFLVFGTGIALGVQVMLSKG
jgi:hypothetical protein